METEAPTQQLATLATSGGAGVRLKLDKFRALPSELPAPTRLEPIGDSCLQSFEDDSVFTHSVQQQRKVMSQDIPSNNVLLRESALQMWKRLEQAFAMGDDTLELIQGMIEQLMHPNTEFYPDEIVTKNLKTLDNSLIPINHEDTNQQCNVSIDSLVSELEVEAEAPTFGAALYNNEEVFYFRKIYCKPTAH